jgi:GalNAc-alpha-(1->4)-GalNAc-alpha-(1->3)-diNAcBac-PP-undecaprenol alpha-1,4-N-acetyl-D-galactosaminyltransferase
MHSCTAMRITLVITTLQRGGAQRVLSLLANWWVQQGRDVTLLCLNDQGKPAFSLDPCVRLVTLGIQSDSGTSADLFRKIRKLAAFRSVLRKSESDVIISFIDRSNVATLFAAAGLRVPVVVSERTAPVQEGMGFVVPLLRRLVYPTADAIVCQTNSVFCWLRQRFRVPIHVIPNPVVLPPASLNSNLEHKSTGTKQTVIAVGRLVHEKGFDLLLEAFSRVAGTFPHWQLSIVGSGPLKDELEARSRALNLADRVMFAGNCPDPFPLLGAADLFVLSSRVEGFPNALTEAMACALPVISFDCPFGPAEIVRHEVDGLLVPPQDVSALAAALARLMASPQERKRLAARAPDVLVRFSKEKILAMWEEVFDALPLAGRSTGKKASARQESETCQP